MRKITEDERKTIKDNIGRCVDGKMLAGDAYNLLIELAKEWKSNAIRHTEDENNRRIEQEYMMNNPIEPK